MRELPIGERTTATEPEGNWFCRYCGTIITSDAQRIERDGEFRHTFANPGGYVFGIGCFGHAPGCVEAGDYTGEHTWFAGFEWCYAVCSGCTSHLGWRYRRSARAREEAFHGLILDRLIAPEG
jgi:hypothetical protein